MTEFVAVVLVVAIVSTLVGVVGTAVVCVLVLDRKSNRHRELECVRRRWSRWLATHRTMTRATVSLVAAFRELRKNYASEVSGKCRYEEAQRARTYWHDAVREHTRAEVELEIAYWLDNPSNHSAFPRHPASDGFRTAIAGSSDDARALIVRVQEADGKATSFALASIQQELAKQNSRFRNPCRRFVFRWVNFMSQMIDRWASV